MALWGPDLAAVPGHSEVFVGMGWDVFQYHCYMSRNGLSRRIGKSPEVLQLTVPRLLL